MYILFHKYKDCLLLSILYVSSYDLTQSFEHASPLHCCNLLTHQHNKHLKFNEKELDDALYSLTLNSVQ